MKHNAAIIYKYILLGLLLLFISIKTQAQNNLVPNYSFESYTICPTVINNAPLPNPWYYACRSYFTSGYANSCANGSSSNYGVPYCYFKNAWNYQEAHTGQAYIITDYLFTQQPIVQCPLIDSLRKDKRYYCEFYVNQPQMMKYSCNNHGMLFTNTAVFPDTIGLTCGVLQASPQILPYGNPIISDTVNWVKVSGIFKAQGGEKYISIGNFNTWQNTNFIQTNPAGGAGASYLIDDVSVIPLDSMCLKADAGRDTTIKVGDSVFIGSYTNGIDSLMWLQNGITKYDSIRPGFWYTPSATGTTFFILQQTVNGCYSSDTVYINAVLPLNFINYNVISTKEKSVGNIWTTANEINVSHYNIERSFNGNDFTIIGMVKANNKQQNNYTFTDQPTPNTQHQTWFYRIAGVDYDGRKTYSTIKQITFKLQTPNNVFVFPNPAKDVVRIECKEPIKQLLIIDYLGREVSKSLVNSQSTYKLTINNHQLAKGLYVVQVTTLNGKVFNEKLVVQ